MDVYSIIHQLQPGQSVKFLKEEIDTTARLWQMRIYTHHRNNFKSSRKQGNLLVERIK